MNAVPDAASVRRFRQAVTDRFGLQSDDAALHRLGQLLGRRIEATGLSLGAYLGQLERGDAPADELGTLAAELTITESYFYRNIEQFQVFAEVAMPDRIRHRGAAKDVRILSVGCATGEEPYSIAMVLRDLGFATDAMHAIFAIDVNPIAIHKATRGRYSSWSLREFPVESQRRWLRVEQGELVVDPSLQPMVRFAVANLMDEDPVRWREASWDIVFCRNLLMYLAPAHIRLAVERITHALAPGGWLFLGHAETLRGLSNDYHLHHTHGTFYYQRKPIAEPVHPAGQPRPSQPQPDVSGLVEVSWVDAIHRSSARIRQIADPESSSAVAVEPAARRETRRWSESLELLARERYDDALRLLPEGAPDPELLLLRAVLHTHRGELETAGDLCRSLLAVDEMNAGAHYVLALCSEGAGRLREALEHDQVAAYLDPTFAMPHLHAGSMAVRLEQPALATRELGEALTLLHLEDASRLLLFGGGFGRDALITLCRAELRVLSEAGR